MRLGASTCGACMAGRSSPTPGSIGAHVATVAETLGVDLKAGTLLPLAQPAARASVASVVEHSSARPRKLALMQVA
eukprot:4908271-Prymnesium_polylepis.1